jgi:hypothetical protein
MVFLQDSSVVIIPQSALPKLCTYLMLWFNHPTRLHSFTCEVAPLVLAGKQAEVLVLAVSHHPA